ncbi:MAG: septum site-determining protein MinC [Anaerolineae bacterium]|nr:septum site-determining protein MinC [Anaerolineae bacterium]
MAETPITLKGTADGILLKPRSHVWAAVLEALEQALQEAESFFRGSRLIMELGNRELTQDQLTSVRALLMQYDIELWAVLSENETTVRLVRSNGVLTRLPKDTEAKKSPVDVLPPEQQALFLQQTLRSGQSIHYAGNVTLIGDVNPGAEIVAGGNIIVWGTLRGVAHAGAFGDEETAICALDLQPSQIRIAGYIGRPPDNRRGAAEPEIARIEGGQIVAEVWGRKG